MTTPGSRSVVLTGASTGIGRAAVAELVRAGFHVWATVRREVDATSLVDEFGDAVTTVIVDLEDHDSVRAAGARVCAAGPLHGLVNNAGAAIPGPLELLPIEAFRRQLDINLTGQLLMTQVMLPALFAAAEQNGDARIVMIGSVGGRIAGPLLGAYSAAKHGLVGRPSSRRSPTPTPGRGRGSVSTRRSSPPWSGCFPPGRSTGSPPGGVDPAPQLQVTPVACTGQ